MLDFIKKELSLKAEQKRTITFDLTLPKSKTPTPVAIFCHGFKGFKDWGHLNWVANEMAKNNIALLKFNFSMNGVAPKKLNDISDLETFSNNNYSIEVEDLNQVINWVEENYEENNLNKNEIYLIAHSRGGGIAILKAANDKRIKKLVLWASLSEFDSFFREDTIKEWNENGVVYAENKRTGQQLPLKKQLYDDYIKNKPALDLQKALLMMDVPLLILHGEKDETVGIKHAETIYNIVQHSILIKMENANHTFGAKHPFDETSDVVKELEELIENTVEFLID